MTKDATNQNKLSEALNRAARPPLLPLLRHIVQADAAEIAQKTLARNGISVTRTQLQARLAAEGHVTLILRGLPSQGKESAIETIDRLTRMREALQKIAPLRLIVVRDTAAITDLLQPDCSGAPQNSPQAWPETVKGIAVIPLESLIDAKSLSPEMALLEILKSTEENDLSRDRHLRRHLWRSLRPAWPATKNTLIEASRLTTRVHQRDGAIRMLLRDIVGNHTDRSLLIGTIPPHNNIATRAMRP